MKTGRPDRGHGSDRRRSGVDEGKECCYWVRSCHCRGPRYLAYIKPWLYVSALCMSVLDPDVKSVAPVTGPNGFPAPSGTATIAIEKIGINEDAEKFLGLFLDTLEEELLALAPAVASAPTPTPAGVEAEDPPEAQDGWLEVGRKNRAIVTRFIFPRHFPLICATGAGWWVEQIKEAESPISRIFGGKSRSTLRAAGQRESAIIEAWRTLRLDSQTQSTRSKTRSQVVQMGSADANLQILIAALPPVLVLHVKRFYYDAAAGVIKLAKHVAFGPELEIGGEVLAPTATTTGRKPIRYKLFAAVYHHGVSAAGGHYTLDVLHATRGWVRIDDELVSDVRAEDVFGVEREREEERCAYLLFYRRVR
ncbi:hypothetical protein DFH09DRAFT_1377182 [Mycena vulgaris]|nr:hypothetical protein DFH09DRAFT_1377182 [Mycena vulgaris]